eukprot:920516-Pleurochrysis_carterae.AAC.1
MPPNARPVPKQRPTHTLTNISRTAGCVNSGSGSSMAPNPPARARASLAASGVMRSGCVIDATSNRPDRSVAVAAAQPMNTQTATMERRERREMPHRPWPDVHPFPRTVPKPIAMPLTSSCGDAGGAGISKQSGFNFCPTAAPEVQRPARKASLAGSAGPSTSALRAPELPATRCARSM